MKGFAEENEKTKFILTVIDIFSKYGWMIPLKNKKGESVANAFEKIFKERKPSFLWTDKGLEFWNSKVKELLKKKGVKLYSTENEEKSSVVKRWNRTMKEKMWKMFDRNNSLEYLEELPKLVKDYNNTKHNSIGMTPVEASKKKNEKFVFSNLY